MCGGAGKRGDWEAVADEAARAVGMGPGSRSEVAAEREGEVTIRFSLVDWDLRQWTQPGLAFHSARMALDCQQQRKGLGVPTRPATGYGTSTKGL